MAVAASSSKSFRSSRVLRGALALLWAGCALAGAKVFWDMSWGTGADNPISLARESQRLIAPRSSPASLGKAEDLIRQELSFGPYRAEAWCRLAYVQFRRSGRFDASVAQTLRRSYEVAPFSSEAFIWRTEFMFDHWPEAPDDLKQRALRETRAFYSLWANRQDVELMAARVENPAGRLAIELVLLSSPVPKS